MSFGTPYWCLIGMYDSFGVRLISSLVRVKFVIPVASHGPEEVYIVRCEDKAQGFVQPNSTAVEMGSASSVCWYGTVSTRLVTISPFYL